MARASYRTVEEGRVKKEGVAQRKLVVVLQGTPTHKMGSAHCTLHSIGRVEDKFTTKGELSQ